MSTELLESVIEKHLQCVAAVKSSDYYLHIYRQLCIMPRNLREEIQTTEDETKIMEFINSFWNKFWCALPDSPAIHRGPFNMICDLAEGAYLEPPEED